MRDQLTRSLNTPLKTEILHEQIICMQYFSLELLQWLEDWVKTSKVIRQALSFVLLEASYKSYSINRPC
jgi:hypothetical protein